MARENFIPGKGMASYDSFVQGRREASLELGDPVPSGYEERFCPEVDEEHLDLTEFLRGQVQAIIDHIKAQKQ